LAKKPKENQLGTKQVEAFRRVARELGCDEDEAAFEERLRKIAKATPSTTVPKKKKSTRK
jgi:hypothetical protein